MELPGEYGGQEEVVEVHRVVFLDQVEVSFRDPGEVSFRDPGEFWVHEGEYAGAA